MKKAYKIMLIAAGSAFVLGLALVIVSAIMGVSSGEISEAAARNSKNVSETFKDVKKLDINIPAGEFNIEEGDELAVYASYVSNDFVCTEENGTLKIHEAEHSFFGFSLFDWRVGFGKITRTPEITLYVPREYTFDEITVKAGASKSQINGLNAKKADLEIGVGEMTVKRANLSNLSIKCGVGHVKIDGIVKGKSKIECGVGKVELDLSGKKRDYGFDLKVGIGKIEIGDDKMSGDNKKITSDTENSFDVNCGIGEVSIDFEGRGTPD